MILAVDIGNSNICIGGLDGMKVLFTARMVTRPRCTGDEYTAELKFLLGRLGVTPEACEGVIVCSVVPDLTKVLADACTRLTGRNAMLVSPALNTGLTFAVDAPDRVGRDRIADATADQPEGHQQRHSAAAAYLARNARSPDWPQHGGMPEQRRDVWHRSHAGRPGCPRGSRTWRAADRGCHRRPGPLHHALLHPQGDL